ncbi:MAG TPA: hypothetical protein PK733_06545 [Clostridiales bacterium]|nr:hypothetical protein [Clostridiales bacterium]
MKTSDLLISSVNITEDEYHYKGQFVLSSEHKSLIVDLAVLYDDNEINNIKEEFNLQESNSEIRESLLNRLVIKAGISSKIVQGEDYFELKAKRT